MSCNEDLSCGCPPIGHPRPPLIPAGLSALALRQAAGFPEYRAAMLSAIRGQPALADWRARSREDLGLMLVEAWAYVLDVTGFYDARSAERSYLATAPDARSAQRLSALLGHRPRPPMAARVQLAIEVDGHDPLPLPAGTAFRSGPFEGEAPQVFELVRPHTVWPQRNRWALAPIRENSFDGVLRFAPRRAPSAGAILLVRSSAQAVAVRVLAVDSELADDGFSYQRASLSAFDQTALQVLVGSPLDALSVEVLRQPVSRNVLKDAEGTSSLDLTLDALYPQLRAGTWAVLEQGSGLLAVRLQTVSHGHVLITSGQAGSTTASVQIPVSVVRLEPAVTASPGAVLHVSPWALGAPTRPAKTALELTDLQPLATLSAPVPALAGAPASAAVIASGARKRGQLLSAQVQALGAGAASVQVDATSPAFNEPLQAPVQLFGNVVEAVRGESIRDEILGSGDASQPSLSFKLKKKPLTWVEDAARIDRRRPELVVRVDGVAWDWVETLFGHGPHERVYRLRLDAAGDTWVEFGFGRSALPGTGVANVRADYRFGAGAAKPPPGSISQIAVPVRGLGAVRGPLPASGGADEESADSLRTAAPAAALTLGRAVSLADFEALARSYSGVLNASAAWAWDQGRQRACVKLWVIAEGGDPSATLRLWLAARAVADLQIVVAAAQKASATELSISLKIDPRHSPDQVHEHAHAALFDAQHGLLSPSRQRIGAALFRSALSLALHQVAGVQAVREILIDGLPMPRAIAPGDGRWFDFSQIHLS